MENDKKCHCSHVSKSEVRLTVLEVHSKNGLVFRGSSRTCITPTKVVHTSQFSTQGRGANHEIPVQAAARQRGEPNVEETEGGRGVGAE